MRSYITLITLLLISAASASASQPIFEHARYNNEQSDTAQITKTLDSVSAMRLSSQGDIVAESAKAFVGKPYAENTLEGAPEMLTVNTDQLDYITLVQNAVALAISIDENRCSWPDFIFNLKRIRYRGGSVEGYTSRLHYISDWAVDNIHRGILKNATYDFPRYASATRSLDYMSQNADKFPALSDSATVARIKEIENGYKGYRFPYIKPIDLSNKEVKAEFRNGDILAFVSKEKNLDYSHMGILIIGDDGEMRVLHASSQAGKVVISDLSLADFMKRNRQYLGISVFRLVE